MFTHLVFWLWFLGLIYLFVGLIVARREFIAARGLNKLIALGPVFVGAPLAVFSAEHFVLATSLAKMVPVWMPARLFWAYFVGCCLLAAATSLVAMKFLRLSATLLGVMFLGFVLMIHLPFAVTHPANRLGWNFALRETAFAAGAWALAGSQIRKSQTRNAQASNSHAAKRNWMILFGRFWVAIAVIYFGLEQMLHPEFTPGVPDTKLTPNWVPFHALWGYPAGAFLVLAGTMLLINKRPRAAAAWIGAVMAFLTVALYLPILALTKDPSQMLDAINFVADTLLFAGTALLLARALPSPEAATSVARAPSPA